MLKNISFILIVIGTVGASISAARTMPDEPGWENTWQISTVVFCCYIAMLIMGIIFSKFKSNPLLDQENEEDDTPPLLQLISDAVTKVQLVSENTGSLSTQEIYQQVSDIAQQTLEPFDENRFWIIDRYGMGKYAVVMAPFAQAERYLNRAWSASVDGYKDESVEYLKRSIPSLQESHDELKKLLHPQSGEDTQRM